MSWRLMIWEDTATGAAPSSIVTSSVIRARWRCVKDTMREVVTFTRLPDGVRQISSRRSTPSRKSIQRSYSMRSAIDRSRGSSSTYSFMTVESGTEIMVWPVRAKPKADSAWLMRQVSWKPLRNVPWLSTSLPSEGVPRIPR